jgi:DNA-binding phage protein
MINEVSTMPLNPKPEAVPVSLTPIVHFNYYGKEGIYCRMRHKTIKDLEVCHECPLLGGFLQGEGIECYWDDYEASYKMPGFGGPRTPKKEFIRVEKLIKAGHLDRNPAREGEAYSYGVIVARCLAITAHRGQTDRAGAAYIEHPSYVAGLVETDEEKAVAWLHDVLEDTDTSAETLAENFPARIVEAVTAITKIKGEDYNAYLARVKANPIARAVKLADLTHNMMIERIPAPTDKDHKRLEKYKRAYEELKGKD